MTLSRRRECWTKDEVGRMKDEVPETCLPHPSYFLLHPLLPMSSIFNLNNEVAVVLGGTGALGGSMADALAAAGAKVVVVGRNEERGAERVKAIQTAGGQAMFQSADALDRAS